MLWIRLQKECSADDRSARSSSELLSVDERVRLKSCKVTVEAISSLYLSIFLAFLSRSLFAVYTLLRVYWNILYVYSHFLSENHCTFWVSDFHWNWSLPPSTRLWLAEQRKKSIVNVTKQRSRQLVIVYEKYDVRYWIATFFCIAEGNPSL